ncbi:hypothetical protein EKO04_002407 [Ascochyta lentis]|uniref:AAA+ ATPase domain-containing protein n=1 Tax=Ascochyta lentis TaxID=205686 RepID=A0A8H7JCB9_9PLEO|nr:hypothetical protein EKO04_002407 [Ascochyta lentis]
MNDSALQPFARTPSSDIFADVFDWVFDNDVFRRWRRGTGAWQLHCVGGPGSGKTTLATLIAQHLEQHPEHKHHPVISLQIDRDVADHEITTVEDLLKEVYRSLEEYPTLQSDDSYNFYNHYLELESLPEGARRRERLRTLRKAVHAQLEATEDPHTFLIVDGLDRCGPTLRYMLESEFTDLQHRGVRVLLTSRFAVFEQKEALCSHKCHEDVADNALDLYLQCRNCDRFAMCFPCKDAQRICDSCNVEGSLYEPYDHVSIRIWVPYEAMAKFVAWDLEREHGDLGLNSSARKPPLSLLGETLLSNQATKPIHTLVDDITAYSYENIGIARARLDLVHDMESLDSLQARKDQLPATIVALYDLGLRGIEQQSQSQRDLALKAIAAVARHDNGELVGDLLNQLRKPEHPELRSGEEIVEATRGWLVDFLKDGPQRLMVYNTNFMYYVEQRYHRAIHRTSIQIESDSRRTTGRSEPQDDFKEPTRGPLAKPTRAVTYMPAIEEAPAHPFIVRKGTLAWN